MKNFFFVLPLLFLLSGCYVWFGIPMQVKAHEIHHTEYCENKVSNLALLSALEDAQHKMQHNDNRAASAKLFTIASYMKACHHPLYEATQYVAKNMWVRNQFNEWAYGKVETIIQLMKGR